MTRHRTPFPIVGARKENPPDNILFSRSSESTSAGPSGSSPRRSGKSIKTASRLFLASFLRFRRTEMPTLLVSPGALCASHFFSLKDTRTIKVKGVSFLISMIHRGIYLASGLRMDAA